MAYESTVIPSHCVTDMIESDRFRQGHEGDTRVNIGRWTLKCDFT